ncbi:DUF3592 domain-containing protein [Patescibacteria group bacterium]|nr:DUF3592 domain-containing protein [Patescibacteria group bacterium]
MPTVKGSFLWPAFIPMIILLGLFVYFFGKSLQIVLTSTRTIGMVSDSTLFDTKTQALYQEYLTKTPEQSYTVATFQTPDGTTHFARTRSASSSVIKNGTSVKIYYHPAAPDEAYIGIFREFWLVPLIFFVIWLVFFTIWFGALQGPINVG